MSTAPHHRILIGDVLDGLRSLPDGSARCCVTSPPYWGLRDYGVDGQIGLESTPEAYIERMVGVFREVRRVLADDGTLWLNIGDSYAAGAGGRGDVGNIIAGVQTRTTEVGNGRIKREIPSGLKPKDLVGIPWMLAFALRQPYYTGRIRDERDRIWLAAMIEAEGCLFIHKRKAGQSNGQGYERQNDSYSPGLEVANCHRAIVERCQQITGLGSICSQSPDQNNRRKQTIHRWNLRTTECRDIIREVYPYFVGKQHQARLLCGCPSSGPEAERAHEALKSLHNGCAVDIDFKPPAPMFEPGFYLRSDVIWSKANPMPESVTDRPTKSHEYIFLMSKRERYYFDAEAIKEASVDPESHKGRNARNDDRFVGQAFSDTRGGFSKIAAGTTYPTRNARTVWTIATQPYSEAHFATFPEAIPERCIKAGSSERGKCPECGAAWVRVVEKTMEPNPGGGGKRADTPGCEVGLSSVFRTGMSMVGRTVGWEPTCTHGHDPIPDTVLDPFTGSGTTLLVACRLGRNGIGCELNPEYAAMAERRIGSGLRPSTFRDDKLATDAPLFGATA